MAAKQRGSLQRGSEQGSLGGRLESLGMVETLEIGLSRQRGSRHEGSSHSDGASVVHAGSVQLGSLHPTS